MADHEPEFDDLRELAEAATVGPWTAEAVGSEGFHVFGPDGSRAPMRGRARVATCQWQDWDESCADSAYIAAVNPAVVLALLDRLARVENLIRAAEYQQSTTLSRDFNGRPFEPSIPLSSLRAAVRTPPAAERGGDRG